MLAKKLSPFSVKTHFFNQYFLKLGTICHFCWKNSLFLSFFVSVKSDVRMPMIKKKRMPVIRDEKWVLVLFPEILTYVFSLRVLSFSSGDYSRQNKMHMERKISQIGFNADSLVVWPRCCLVAKSCPTLCDPMDFSSSGSSVPEIDAPGKNTRVGCHFLLQWVFLTQGSNLRLLHWQVDFLLLRHQGSPGDLINQLKLHGTFLHL